MTVKTIALDIETVPVDEVNVKNIQYLREKDKNSRTNRFFDGNKEGTLDFGKKSIGRFELNQIICCCMYDGKNKMAYCFHPDDNISLEKLEKVKMLFMIGYQEDSLLRKINDEINNYSQIITFNGNSFDLPMIRMRSKLLGVKTSIQGDIKPWDSLRYIDVKYLINGADKYSVGDLPYWCRVFGVEPPEWGGNAEHKDNLKKLWIDGRIDEIVKGCCSDVKSTWELYNKIK